MVGRTPEFLGKKIRRPQRKLIVAYALATPIIIPVFGSISLVIGPGTRSILNPGMHGLSEIMYAVAWVTVNNGSAFAGLDDTTLGLAMLAGRFVPIVLGLAIAGSLARARIHVRTRATLDTTGPTFVVFLLGVIVIVGGLIYLPMLHRRAHRRLTPLTAGGLAGLPEGGPCLESPSEGWARDDDAGDEKRLEGRGHCADDVRDADAQAGQ
jgi:K+-transporting ATPase A subunit